METRKALLGHAIGDITTHQLRERLNAAECIVGRGNAETSTLMLVGRVQSVGKVSEIKKGLATKTPLTL